MSRVKKAKKLDDFNKVVAMTPEQIFDEAIKVITRVRGETYDHPSIDFAKVTKLVLALPYYEDPRVRHIMYMLCVKMARLSKTPDHVDSWIDIAGYARTGVMLIGK